MSETRDGCELAGFELGWGEKNLEDVLQNLHRPSPELLRAAELARRRMALRRLGKEDFIYSITV